MALEFYCNKCGKKMDEFDVMNGVSIETDAGYGSVFDGEYIRLDLCIDCFDEILKSCKISPWAYGRGCDFHIVEDEDDG